MVTSLSHANVLSNVTNNKHTNSASSAVANTPKMMSANQEMLSVGGGIGLETSMRPAVTLLRACAGASPATVWPVPKPEWERNALLWMSMNWSLEKMGARIKLMPRVDPTSNNAILLRMRSRHVVSAKHCRP